MGGGKKKIRIFRWVIKLKKIIIKKKTDPNMTDEIQITVIATGFEKEDDKVPSLSDITSKSWSPKPMTSSSVESTNSNGDLDIPTFLRKNKGK